MTTQPNAKPALFLMIIDGQRSWLPLRRAGVALDNGWVPVSIGGLVMDPDGAERSITDAERQAIVDAADDHSESK